MGIIKELLHWERRVFLRAWDETCSWIKGLGLWWDLALILGPPVAVWLLRDSAVTLTDVLWAVGGGWASVLAILLLRGAWNYIWAPFKQDRDQRRELRQLKAEGEFPDVHLTTDRNPVLFITKAADGSEVRYIIIRNVVITAREAPVTLDWRLHLTTELHKHGLILKDPARSPVGDWEDLVQQKAWPREDILAPPLNFQAPSSRHGYIAFPFDRGPQLLSSEMLFVEDDPPPPVDVTIILQDRQSDVDEKFALENPLKPDDYRVVSK